MDEKRGFGLRRLLLNLGGKRRAHDEVQQSLSSISRRATSVDDGVPRRRDGRPGGQRVRQVSPPEGLPI